MDNAIALPDMIKLAGPIWDFFEFSQILVQSSLKTIVKARFRREILSGGLLGRNGAGLRGGGCLKLTSPQFFRRKGLKNPPQRLIEIGIQSTTMNCRVQVHLNSHRQKIFKKQQLVNLDLNKKTQKREMTVKPTDWRFARNR